MNKYHEKILSITQVIIWFSVVFMKADTPWWVYSLMSFCIGASSTFLFFAAMVRKSYYEDGILHEKYNAAMIKYDKESMRLS